MKKSLVKKANFYQWRRKVFYRISSSCFKATWSVNNDCPVPNFLIIIDMTFLTAELIEGKKAFKCIYKFRLSKVCELHCLYYIQCNICIFFNSNNHFQHFLPVADKQIKGAHWGSRVHMGGIKGANHLAPLIPYGCLVFFTRRFLLFVFVKTTLCNLDRKMYLLLNGI